MLINSRICDILKSVHFWKHEEETCSLVGKLGVHEFMVLTSGGTPLFHYSIHSERKLDELLSGFLSAITSFATEFGEKSIQSLSFEGSELLYEQYGADHIFIFLVESGASCEVFSILKRPDEKYVTEEAYNNPMFVEDVVRKVAEMAQVHPNISWFSVGVESFESIHKHSAYAYVDSSGIEA